MSDPTNKKTSKLAKVWMTTIKTFSLKIIAAAVIKHRGDEEKGPQND